MTTIKCSLANEIITTCHVRRIFTPIDETIKKIIYLMQQFVKCNNSISIQSKWIVVAMQMKKCLIVTTINPIWHSPYCTSWFTVLSSHS